MIEGCDDAQRNLCLSGRLMTMMQINLSPKTQWLVDELSYYPECLWEDQPWLVKMTRMNFGNSFAGPQMCHFGQIGAKKESNSQHKEILRYLTFRASLPCRQILLQRHFHCFRTHAAQGSTMQYSASDDENLFLRNI